MKFRCKKSKDYYLLDTPLENIFINEYMTSAPGDYVKVYIFARMYAEVEEQLSMENMAKQLAMKPEDVKKAWEYWERMDVVRIIKDSAGEQVEFVNLKELLYSKHKEQKKQPEPITETGKKSLSDKGIQNMYQSIERILGRPMNGTETMEILSWIDEEHAEPEIIAYAYSYCKEKGKENVKYVASVVKRWVSQGLNDVLAVEEYLDKFEERQYLYRRVFKALGFMRNVTEEEQKIMNRWFDHMGYSIDRVLEACKKTSGISNPNINYVNKILSNWYEEETGTAVNVDNTPKPATAAEVQKYYTYLRNRADDEAQERTKEIYRKIPEIREIEEKLNACSMQISKVYLSGSENKEVEVKRLQDLINDLTQERAILLTENDFALDYMDVHYRCPVCKDTGTNDEGGRCECYSLRAKEAEIWQKNQN